MAAVPQAYAQRIEELVLRIDTISDPESRQSVRELMQSVLELHGAALERMMQIAATEGDRGEALIRKFGNDNLVGALLILHDLHPDDLAARIQRAIGKWHGSVELIGEFQGVVRIRLSAGGCGMKEAVEAAIREAAPDVNEVVFEESHQPAGFIPLSSLVPTPISVSGAD